MFVCILSLLMGVGRLGGKDPENADAAESSKSDKAMPKSRVKPGVVQPSGQPPQNCEWYGHSDYEENITLNAHTPPVLLTYQMIHHSVFLRYRLDVVYSQD